MTEARTEPSPAPIEEVRAIKISTADASDPPRPEKVCVIQEVALTIDVEQVENYTLMCTPGAHRELTAGFLVSEGIVDHLREIRELRECSDEANVVRVRLHEARPRIDDAERNLLIVSSCGMCGIADLQTRLRALPRVGDTLHVPSPILRRVGRELPNHQPLFRSSGGAHAAGIFDAQGKILATAEDAGRHNALDKAIGGCLLEGGTCVGRAAVLSGRVSLEMVAKCARAGIELISAISAPTALAIEVATRCNITLCAFVRAHRATVFSHPARILETSQGAEG